MSEIKPNDQALLSFMNRKAFRDNLSFYTRMITCEKENDITIPFSNCEKCEGKCERHRIQVGVMERFSAQKKIK